jgi:predicted NUDIX family NTP pyrophosphohydrolase
VVIVPRTSAGLLIYRRRETGIEVLLVHPGGPFFAGKHEGAWTVPKGEPGDGEDLLAAAIRECEEETGFAPSGPFLPLTPVLQRGGKRVHAWAVEADWDPTALRSNAFTIEWPPRSGRLQSFPEVDRAAWCSVETARRSMNPAQTAWLDELAVRLGD